MSSSGSRRAGGGGSSADVLGFSESAFVLLRDLIAQRTGVYFSNDKRDLLADKLADLLAARGMTSYLDFYYLLRYDADAPRHWRELTDHLAVPETYFWRQPDQVLAVARVLAPQHFARRPSTPFRIWSAACCTGEEPLSIVIALAEAGLLERYPFEILGSDASAAMLERARTGLYGERSFRALPPELRARYFRAESRGWRIDPALHCHVQWTMANLVDRADVAPLAAVDVVFCRNVLIYFADDTVAQVARMLADVMPDDAHLCLGASESLTRTSTAFELVEVGGAFMYTKGASQNGTRPREAGDRAPDYLSTKR
jgi:chemotaxis protein methyltransferase CheR